MRSFGRFIGIHMALKGLQRVPEGADHTEGMAIISGVNLLRLRKFQFQSSERAFLRIGDRHTEGMTLLVPELVSLCRT